LKCFMGPDSRTMGLLLLLHRMRTSMGVMLSREKTNWEVMLPGRRPTGK
jgi:hypothetical protein